MAGPAKPRRCLRASPGQIFLSQQSMNMCVHPSEALGSCLCLTHSLSVPVPWQDPLQQALPVGRLCRCGLMRHGGSAPSLLSLCQPPPAQIRVLPIGVLLLLGDTEWQLDMMKAPVPFLTVFGGLCPQILSKQKRSKKFDWKQHFRLEEAVFSRCFQYLLLKFCPALAKT